MKHPQEATGEYEAASVYTDGIKDKLLSPTVVEVFAESVTSTDESFHSRSVTTISS